QHNFHSAQRRDADIHHLTTDDVRRSELRNESVIPTTYERLIRTRSYGKTRRRRQSSDVSIPRGIDRYPRRLGTGDGETIRKGAANKGRVNQTATGWIDFGDKRIGTAGGLYRDIQR